MALTKQVPQGQRVPRRPYRFATCLQHKHPGTGNDRKRPASRFLDAPQGLGGSSAKNTAMGLKGVASENGK